jgi:hypothetical protein
MSGLEHAVQGLRQAVDSPRRQHMWRWLVRNRLSAVKEALLQDGTPGGDAWLAPREFSLLRERNVLLAQVADVGPLVLDDPDLDRVHDELCRLVSRLARYRQRVNDLVYDSVALELGGSE